jgi:hypothetical protein
MADTESQHTRCKKAATFKTKKLLVNKNTIAQ